MERRSRYLLAVALVFVILGAGFRLWRLEGSVFSSDETVAAQHTAGYLEREVLDGFADGRVVTASEARRFDTPGKARSAGDVVAALAVEDPQHPPLFYVMERWWLDAAGSSVAARRELPAIIGLFGIAAAGWLCALATRSAVGGWAGAALFAISPFEVVYAQEMREYSLFATLTCIATALLLVALRKRGVAGWIAYSAACAAGLYTFTMFPLVIAAHVTILMILRPGRGMVLRCGAAIAAACVAWLPWAAVIIQRRDLIASTNDWSATRWPPFALGAKWLFNAATTFFDLMYIDPRWAPVAALVLVALALALLGLRRAPREAQAIVWSLLGWCFGVLAVVDLSAGGHRSTVARYVTPVFCALVVAVAAWVASVWNRSPRRAALPVGAALVLCACGVLSLGVRAQHGAWWDNAKDGGLRAIVATIDEARLPVLVTDGNWPIILNAANYTRTNPVFVLAPADRIESIAARMGPALVLTTSNASRSRISDNPQLRSEVLYVSSTTPSAVMFFRKRMANQDGAGRLDPVVDDARAALLRVVNRSVAARPNS